MNGVVVEQWIRSGFVLASALAWHKEQMDKFLFVIINFASDINLGAITVEIRGEHFFFRCLSLNTFV